VLLVMQVLNTHQSYASARVCQVFSLALAYVIFLRMATKRKDPAAVTLAAVTLGRKGGKSRAENRGWEKIPAEKRSEMARKAVLARWAKVKRKPRA
jgi:hypothetical protein